jgi:hypothetical protein
VDERVKLFDIESYPEEMIDLSHSEPDITAELLGELKAKLEEVNKPIYRRLFHMDIRNTGKEFSLNQKNRQKFGGSFGLNRLFRNFS